MLPCVSRRLSSGCWVGVLAGVLMGLGGSTTAHGAAGTPAPRAGAGLAPALVAAFGAGGVARVDVDGADDTGYALASLPDGGVVVAGLTRTAANSSLLLVGLTADGALRGDFGAGGLVTQDFFGDVTTLAGIVRQSDGALVVAGTLAVAGEARLLVARFLPDGAPDPAFGSGGYVSHRFGAGAFTIGHAIALQPDGKVLVGGTADNIDRPGDAVWFLARYTAAGALDGTFGAGGVAKLDVSPVNQETVNAILVQPDGRIMAAGGADNDRLHVARYLTTGALDPSFASAGVLTDYDLAPASAILQQPDGAYIVGGNRIVSVPGSAVSGALGYLQRFAADGAKDYAFRIENGFTRDAGGAIVPQEKTLQGVWALARYPNGKIAVAGTLRGEYAVAVHNPDGSLDAGFGEAGFERPGLPASDARALVLDGYTSLLAAGWSAGDLVVTRHDAAGEQFALSFARSETAAVEGGGAATVAVRLGAPSATPVTVDYATSDGTATAGADYVAASGTVTFAPGETLQTFAVDVVSDAEAEPNETVVLTLSHAVGAILGKPNPAALVIQDNPSVTLGPATLAVLEASGHAVLHAYLNTPATAPVMLDYAVTGITAVAGLDFTTPSGSVTIPAGASKATIDIPIVADAIPEPEKQLEVRLTSATNASVRSGLDVSTVTIIDDPSSCSVCPVVTVGEKAGSVAIPVDNAGTQATSVTFATVPGSATPGADYLPASGTLTLPVGGEGAIDVPILPDREVRPGRNVRRHAGE